MSGVMLMRKKILSFVVFLSILCSVFSISAVNVKAEDVKTKQVDGSYLTTQEISTGTVRAGSLSRGAYLMDGDSTISKAGRGRIYAYGATTANTTVDYVCVIVYVDQYNEETDAWQQIDAWVAENDNTYYIATSKTLTVDRGYYYRVHSDHIAGNEEDRPFDAATSLTDGIWIN